MHNQWFNISTNQVNNFLMRPLTQGDSKYHPTLKLVIEKKAEVSKLNGEQVSYHKTIIEKPSIKELELINLVNHDLAGVEIIARGDLH